MRLDRKLVLLAALVAATAGCRQDMHDQPVLEAYEESSFFADGRGDRVPIEGTVARGQLREDEAFFSGVVGDGFVTELPVPISRELLERGRERYDIFCSPCHDRVGNGQGMIVRRGLKQPTSFHAERLRQQPVGYFFDVVTRGFGEMSSYAPLITPRDRWAIAAYIRALQRSQNTVLDDLEPSIRSEIVSALETPAETAAAAHSSDSTEAATHE